jgi:proteasome beta subunit
LETRRDVQPNSIAKLMSVIMFERRYFPLLTQVIVGGITTNKPEIYTLDPLGSVLPDRYAAVGTGAEMALGVMDADFSENLDEEKATSLALRAIRSSIQRDSASGDGIDLLIINKDGNKESSHSA